MKIASTAFGYPKIGEHREYKSATEDYWESRTSESGLLGAVEEVNLQRLKKLAQSGVDLVPSNDFSLYDPVLDHSTMFGIIPERFSGIENALARYYAMARGHGNAVACEMTKWFDTNYHYIVPEFTGGFSLTRNRPLESYRWAKSKLNLETKPVMIGPFTFITLGKTYGAAGTGTAGVEKAPGSAKFTTLLSDIALVYNRILRELEDAGVRTVQMDEPALVMDRSDSEIAALIDAYAAVMRGLDRIEVHVHTYYESLSSFRKIVHELPVHGIGLDFTVNGENLANMQRHGFPAGKKLIAGVVSGRDPWKTDFKKAGELIRKLAGMVGDGRLIISNAAPLFHLPVSVKAEKGHLDNKVLEMLSFADERLEELEILKGIINDGKDAPTQDLDTLYDSFKNNEVRQKVAEIDEARIGRPQPFAERYRKQMARFKLPEFPSTTIGSFPQTKDVRKKRSDLTSGKISPDEYDDFIRGKIREVISRQEEIGLDVLVHGEFERTDMVEFFGQKMNGFAFTRNGWVQSYGTRCVRPPVIYGDVSRPGPMTVKEVRYAQSITNKPLKGMLTGPVTIVDWSFYRKDIPKKEVAYQIALALRDEVLDLEKAGIAIIQVDEPAFREGLPLKKEKQNDYLRWAINAFRLTHQEVREDTQIHAHMCYSEFNEIIEYIYAMDADVISFEASRSRGELLEAFEKFHYDHGIGLGVYDVHSPRVPTEDEMKAVVERSVRVIDRNLFWINPDCGLKTRENEETFAALRNMVQVARSLRKERR